MVELLEDITGTDIRRLPSGEADGGAWSRSILIHHYKTDERGPPRPT